MILGIGIDLIEVPRIAAAVGHPERGDRFKTRVFTPGEIAYCEQVPRIAAQRFAARFAAKEAAMKALGGGFGDGLGWREIEVVRGRGAPRLVLSGTASRWAARLGVARLHVSLTHVREVAMAYVIAEGEVGEESR